tara:strand:+ start:524 stop:727 length:204 start_codon:yes stop_codon:yes gene_type:complete
MEIQKQYTKCIWCNKCLQPIGTARVNGYKHNDWSSRNSHKKCWIENELKQQKKKPKGEYKNVISLEL